MDRKKVNLVTITKQKTVAIDTEVVVDITAEVNSSKGDNPASAAHMAAASSPLSVGCLPTVGFMESASLPPALPIPDNFLDPSTNATTRNSCHSPTTSL